MTEIQFPVSEWTLSRTRLMISWCYPTLVVAFERAVREDEQRKLQQYRKLDT